MEILACIKEHYLLLTILTTSLQVGGTVALALFSFFGIEIIESNPDAYMELTPKVSISPKWLRAAQYGLVALVFGMVLSGLISYAGAA